MTIKALAPAKINLTLDVVGRRADGYHLLRSVMQTVSLYDTVTVTSTENTTIDLICDGGIPADMSNTAYKAAALFRETVGYSGGVAITVEKTIPSQAGLAGGSSDAAAVLVALNELTGAGLTVEQLCELGGRIGADVPLCIHGGTVLCTGIGTQLSPLPPLPPCAVVIVKPRGGVSTPEAYRLLDNASVLHHPDTDGMCRALAQRDLQGVAACVGNSFEQPLALPFTADIRDRLTDGGALASALSGSGSAVFGLFTDVESATVAARSLREYYPNTVVCRPCEGILLEKLV